MFPSEIYVDSNMRRVNPYATFTVNDAVYAGNILNFPDAMAQLGITKIQVTATVPAEYLTDPEFYIVTESDDAPYISYNRRSQDDCNEIRKNQAIKAMDNLLDSTAYAYGYDDIKTAVTYADEPSVPKFQIEGKALRQWRSLVYATGYSIIENVLKGLIALPTLDEVMAQMPKYEDILAQVEAAAATPAA